MERLTIMRTNFVENADAGWNGEAGKNGRN